MRCCHVRNLMHRGGILINLPRCPPFLLGPGLPLLGLGFGAGAGVVGGGLPLPEGVGSFLQQHSFFPLSIN